MSVLVDLIKNIVGDECKINLFDFSCSSISIFTPETQLSTKRSVIPDDIDDLEKGISRQWGGKKSKKLGKRLKRKLKNNKKEKGLQKSIKYNISI